MPLSTSQKLRNEELVTKAFVDANMLCFFCEKYIDRSAHQDPHPYSLAWHHVKGPKEGAISDMRCNATPTKLEAELQKCVPAHKFCHDKHHKKYPRLGGQAVELSSTPRNLLFQSMLAGAGLLGVGAALATLVLTIIK
ncbi:MAG: hypothetical protein JHD10_07865 [Sphingomonadaceae bacterium]|nr:hypothetical protein [Sphingomonadaceae bacterium]